MTESTVALDKALVETRKAIHNPPMDSLNPHFKSKFASLKAVIESTIVVAAQHGIVVIQDLQEATGGMRCFTHLIHESGESRTFGPLYFPCTKQDAQGYASASTYARRYHLMSVFGVVGDMDDDGNAASESAFSSVQKRSRIRNTVLKAIEEGDDEAVAEAFADLDNDQKAELWGLFNAPQKKQIQEAKNRMKEAPDAGSE